MIELDHARALLAGHAVPLVPVTVALGRALGCRVVRCPISDVDLPPADVSAMDGYAVRAADLKPGEPLPVAFEVAAGSEPDELPPASAARIFTGASVPRGGDTVVPQERARVLEDGRVLLETVAEGTHVRRRGEVVALGAELAPAGVTVTPAMISLLASCGASCVEVVPKPRLAVVVTGAELVDVAESPGPGRIRDSNGPLLEALVAASGLDVTRLSRVEDSVGALEDSISSALEGADLVLTTGGVSVGDYDLVPDVVRGLGGEVVFHRVRVKPGKPILAASFGPKWLIGLPGNPLAVLAGWRVFAWPLAAALAGNPSALAEAPVRAVLTVETATPKSRTELRPARLKRRNDGIHATVLGWKGSHDVRTAASADGLVRLEPGLSYPAGSPVAWYGLPSGASWPVDADQDAKHVD